MVIAKVWGTLWAFWVWPRKLSYFVFLRVKLEALCLCLCLYKSCIVVFAANYLETLASVQKKICCLWLLLRCGHSTLWAHCRLFRCDPKKFRTMDIFRVQIKFRNIKAIRALPLEIGRTIRSCQKVASHEVVRSKSTTGGNKKQWLMLGGKIMIWQADVRVWQRWPNTTLVNSGRVASSPGHSSQRTLTKWI